MAAVQQINGSLRSKLAFLVEMWQAMISLSKNDDRSWNLEVLVYYSELYNSQ